MANLLLAMLVLNVAMYATNVYLFFYDLGMTPIKPLYWYVVTAGTGLAVLITHREIMNVSFPKSLMIWIIGYISYNIVSFMFSSQSMVATDVFILQVETALLLFFLVLIMMMDRGVDTVRWIFLAVTIFAVVMNIIDFLVPTWSNVPGRAAGLYVNSNTAGKVIVLAMTACIPVVEKRFRLLFCLFVGIGIMVTFSRSSWMLWAVCVSGLTITGHLSFRNRAVSFILVGLVAIFIVFQLLSGGVVHLIETAGFGRYLTDNTLGRLGGSAGVFEDISAVSRLTAAVMALDVFQQHIWFGQGLGYTREWDYIVLPHNMYLITAAEGGMFGLLVLLAFFVMLWRMADDIGKILVIGMVFYSMFSHTMLTQPPILAIVAFVVASSRFYRREAASANEKESSHIQTAQAALTN